MTGRDQLRPERRTRFLTRVTSRKHVSGEGLAKSRPVPGGQRAVTRQASAAQRPAPGAHRRPTPPPFRRLPPRSAAGPADRGHRAAKASPEQQVPQPGDIHVHADDQKENRCLFVSLTEKQRVDASAAILFYSERKGCREASEGDGSTPAPRPRQRHAHVSVVTFGGSLQSGTPPSATARLEGLTPKRP